jgi:6-phosphogluconolactonase
MIRKCPDLETLSHAAAEEFCRAAQASVAARGLCTVALAGGSTPRRLYELLATSAYRPRVQWERIQVFWGDERMVFSDDPNSNFRTANEALLGKIPIPAGNIHRIPTEHEDPIIAARAYEDEIAHILGRPQGGGPPALDLIFLGMGADGHTASLFPYTDALNETSRWVVSNRAPVPPVDRITMTAPIINAARRVIFLVAGSDKAHALAQVLEGPSDAYRFPAQLIHPESGYPVWLVDLAAASELKCEQESKTPTSDPGEQNHDR